MEPGIYPAGKISNEDYHNKLPGISNSGMVKVAKSPYHYHMHKMKSTGKLKYYPPEDPTPAMVFGQAFHVYILEPKKFKKRVALLPEGLNLRTKVGKAEYAEFKKKNKKRIIIKTEDVHRMEVMKDSLLMNEHARDILSAFGYYEQSIFWFEEHFNVLCKCRPDKRIPKLKALVDLKTARDASPWGFPYAVRNFKYHWQAYWYLRGINAVQKTKYTKFIYVVVENDFPFGCAVYWVNEDDLYIAQQEIRPHMEKYAECVETDIWPGYEPIQHLELLS